MTNFAKLMIIVALFFGLIMMGCENLFNDDENSFDDEDTDAVLVIVNNSADPITGVYITPSTSSEHGLNRLAASESIAPDTQRQFRIEKGIYNVYLETFDGYWDFGSLDLRESDYRLTASDGE